MSVLMNLKIGLAARGMRAVDLAQATREHPSKVSLIMNGRLAASPEFRQECARILQFPERWLFSTHRRLPVVEAPQTEQVAMVG